MLEEYLRHFVSTSQKNWPQLLNVAQFCFNAQKSSTTNKSAFEIVSGQQPLLPHTVDEYKGKVPRAYNFTKEWKDNAEIARAYLEKASKRMKKWANQGRRPLDFQPGDLVLIKFKPEQLRFMHKQDRRLMRKYEGSFAIISKIGKVAYKVEIPAWMKKVHPIFHISNLKLYHPYVEDATHNQLTGGEFKIKLQKKIA